MDNYFHKSYNQPFVKSISLIIIYQTKSKAKDCYLVFKRIFLSFLSLKNLLKFQIYSRIPEKNYGNFNFNNF